MTRYLINVGDVFATTLDDGLVKYFQFIAIDDNQMRSDVIRVFSTAYNDVNDINIFDVIRGPVDFYAHCVIKVGLKNGFWKKVGKTFDVGKLDILFRSSRDFGRDDIKVSNRWSLCHAEP